MSATYNVEIPTYNELLWPTLLAIRELGHTAKLDEIDERVIESQGFTEEQMSVLHKNGPRSEIEYRLAWARTYLKGMEALVNPSRGTWETTPVGKELTEGEVEPRWRDYLVHLAEERKKKKKAAQEAGADPDLAAEDASDETDDWREELLQALLSMDPQDFEHLAKRLLRA